MRGEDEHPRARDREGEIHMTRRRMLHLPALLGILAAAVLIACAAAYRPQTADGSLGAPVMAGWSLKTNEPLE